MDPLQPILADIVKAYQQMEDCKAIALVGSRAKGHEKPWSDVNLMLIVYRPIDHKLRMTVIDSIADTQKAKICSLNPIDSDNFYCGGHQINVWHVPQDVICDRISSIDKRMRVEKTIIITSLHESRILWDPNKQLAAWKSRITPIPEEYTKIVVSQIFTELAIVVRDLANASRIKSIFFFTHELMWAVEDMYEIVFLVNGDYLNLSSQIDSEVRGFSKFPFDLAPRVEELLIGESGDAGRRRKWRLLAELVLDLGRFLEKQNRFELKPGMDLLKLHASFLFKHK